MNRRIINPAMLVDKAVGICRIANSAKVDFLGRKVSAVFVVQRYFWMLMHMYSKLLNNCSAKFLRAELCELDCLAFRRVRPYRDFLLAVLEDENGRAASSCWFCVCRFVTSGGGCCGGSCCGGGRC